MVLGWIQLTLRDIRRRVDIDMVQSSGTASIATSGRSASLSLQPHATSLRPRPRASQVQSNHFEETLATVSSGYHGCTKIVSQPLPFAYEQLIAMLTQLYCFSVSLDSGIQTVRQ